MNQRRTEKMVALAASSVETLISLNNSSSSDEDFIEQVILDFDKRESRTKRPRIENFVENVVYLYGDVEFKKHFRQEIQFFLRMPVNKATFESLGNIFGPFLDRKDTGRDPVPVKTQLLIALWRFATPDSYRSIAARFNVGESTSLRVVRRVVNSILEKKQLCVKWPNAEEHAEIHNAFFRKKGFPKVLGVIDGTHIKIAAAGYINKKGYHSIQLQVVCDHRRKFIHCFRGYPGSVNDERVFTNSDIKEFCSNSNMFSDNCHLIGDAVYMNQKHLLSPFKDNGHLTNRQKNYNYCLSSTRIIVEASIGLLKQRFRLLLDCMPNIRTDWIPLYIMSCCILHNICIDFNDIDVDEGSLTEEDHLDNVILCVQEQLKRGAQKRDAIMNELPQHLR